MNTAILIVAILIVLVIAGGVMLALNSTPRAKLVVGVPYDHILNHHGLMKLVKHKKIALNNPKHVILPDALPAMKPELLSKVSVKTLQDTASLANAVVMSMSLDLDHLKALSPDQIVSLTPFQLTMIDAQYGGLDGQFNELAPLVTPDQLTAVRALFAKAN